MTRALTAEAEKQHLHHQLAKVQDRLIAHYSRRDDVTEDSVRHTFHLLNERYADARIRAFVPILVERGVRRVLHH